MRTMYNSEVTYEISDKRCAPWRLNEAQNIHAKIWYRWIYNERRINEWMNLESDILIKAISKKTLGDQIVNEWSILLLYFFNMS